MTGRAVWIGVIATGAIMLVMMVAAVREPSRLDHVSAQQRAAALQRGMDLYAFHCAECHGSRGQGEVTEDATTLNDDYMRHQDADWLYKTIERGRDDTEMAAFHIDEGGALNRQQIESLVTVIRHGSWDAVAVRVAELDMISEEELALADQDAFEAAAAGMPVIMVVPTPMASDNTGSSSVPPDTDTTDTTPPLVIMVAPTEDLPEAANDMLPMIAVDPTGMPTLTIIGVQPTATKDIGALDDLRPVLNLYATYCAECHGVRGEGVDDYPSLDTPNVQAMSSRELGRISFDNPQIEGHDDMLAPDETLALIALMQRGFSQGE